MSSGGARPRAGRKPLIRACANVSCGATFVRNREHRLDYCSKSCARACRKKRGRAMKPLPVRTCQCGVQFVGQRRTCSSACRAAVYKALGAKAAAWAKANCTVYGPMVCEQCGSTFRRNPHANKKRPDTLRFCSRACSFASLSDRKAERIELEQERRSSALNRTCQVCGVSFRAKKATAKFCCYKCFNSIHLAHRRMERAKLRKRKCSVCSVVFHRTTHGRVGFYCSKTCARSVEKRTRPRGGKSSESRARRKGAKVDYSITPAGVCARDGWHCRLCGRSTPSKLRGTYLPNAPEVDHIVPIGAGGAHTWDNVQCACRACNIKKGDKPLGQMRLAVG